MKAIIAEQADLEVDHGNDEVDYLKSDVRSNSMSTVYSLSDEDRTQFSQNGVQELKYLNPTSEDGDNFQVNHTDKNQITKDFQERNLIVNDNNKYGEVIERDNAIEHNEIAVDKLNVLGPTIQDMAMHNALSNLTLSDADESQPMCTDVENSQNILNNVNLVQYPTTAQTQCQNIGVGVSVPIISNNVETGLVNVESSRIQDTKSYMEAKDFNETVKSKPVKSTDVQNPQIMNDLKKIYNLQKTEVIHVDLPGSINNSINLEIKTTPADPSLFTLDNKPEPLMPVVWNRLNTIVLLKNGPESTLNESETIYRNSGLTNQVAARKPNNNTLNPVLSNTFIQLSKNITDKENIHTEYGRENCTLVNTNVKQNNNIITLDSKMSTNRKTCKDKQIKNKTGYNDQNHAAAIKRKRAPRKKKIINVKVTDTKEIEKVESNDKFKNNLNANAKPKRKNLGKQSKVQTNTTSKISIPIYNQNVIDDLSWIENIRFVREINEDEYDHEIVFEENFWTDYSLPPNFHQNDFI